MMPRIKFRLTMKKLSEALSLPNPAVVGARELHSYWKSLTEVTEIKWIFAWKCLRKNLTEFEWILDSEKSSKEFKWFRKNLTEFGRITAFEKLDSNYKKLAKIMYLRSTDRTQQNFIIIYSDRWTTVCVTTLSVCMCAKPSFYPNKL